MSSNYEDHDETMETIRYALDENPSLLVKFEDIVSLERFALTADRAIFDGDDLAAVVRLKSGGYAALEGGCDYTGWDCQSSLDVTRWKTAEKAFTMGITQDGRSHIERSEAALAEETP